MNKEEAKQKLHNLAFAKLNTKPDDLKLADVMRIVNQIYEPKKPVVPQFVADYIEFKKEQNFHVYGAMRVIEGHYDKRVPDWFYEGNIKTFVRAWLDGYEVEEEKRYTVKMKGVSENNTLIYDTTEECWFFEDDNNEDPIRAYHTRKELEEAGFCWVFDCEGVEVQEVE